MGKSQFNFGKNAREKARQLKQMEKLAKRSQAKKYKADMEKILNKKPEISEQKPDPIIVVEPL
ncbi:MAG: hypothetical protein JW902_10720 [Syntrophaceae bacterium]|nr:hypothetical protein [Syntrophaceae bacterium]